MCGFFLPLSNDESTFTMHTKQAQSSTNEIPRSIKPTLKSPKSNKLNKYLPENKIHSTTCQKGIGDSKAIYTV